MIIAHIEGATRICGKAQGYLGLPLRDELINDTVNGETTPAMVTAWTPTPEELAELNRGASVHVRILGSVPPPMMVLVGPAPEQMPAAPDPQLSAGTESRKAFAEIKRIAINVKPEEVPAALSKIVRLCIDAGAASPAARNWTEDAGHENGNYECRCVECEQPFIGHKRRVLCKACSNLLSPAVPQAAPQLDDLIVRNALLRKAVEASRVALADGAMAGPFVDEALRLINSALSRPNQLGGNQS